MKKLVIGFSVVGVFFLILCMVVLTIISGFSVIFSSDASECDVGENLVYEIGNLKGKIEGDRIIINLTFDNFKLRNIDGTLEGDEFTVDDEEGRCERITYKKKTVTEELYSDIGYALSEGTNTDNGGFIMVGSNYAVCAPTDEGTKIYVKVKNSEGEIRKMPCMVVQYSKTVSFVVSQKGVMDFTEVVKLEKETGYVIHLVGKLEGSTYTMKGDINGIPFYSAGTLAGRKLSGRAYWGEGAALMDGYRSPFRTHSLVITSAFGWRIHPVSGEKKYHDGWDLCQPGNDDGKIFASMDGVVTYANRAGGYGKCVIIDHGNGISTLYAHLKRIHVKQGQKVYVWQQIGIEGSTGVSTGNHLHWEFIQDNVPGTIMGERLDAEELAPGVIQSAGNYSQWANTKTSE